MLRVRLIAIIFTLLFTNPLHAQELLKELNIGMDIKENKNSFYFDSIWLKSADINDDDAYGFLNRASSKLEYGFFEEALADIQSSLEIDSAIAHAYFLKGIIKYYQGSNLVANTIFREGLKYDSLNPALHYFMGENYLALDSVQQAKKNFKYALKLDSEYFLGYFGLANYHFYHAELFKSRRFYKKTIKSNPQFPEAYANKIIVEMMLNKLGAALRTCKKAIEVNPEISHNYFLKGYIYLFRNNSGKALDNWNTAIELDSTNAFYFYSRAVLLAYEKEYQKSFADIHVYFNKIPALKNQTSNDISTKRLQALQTMMQVFEKHKHSISPDLEMDIVKGLCQFFIEEHYDADKTWQGILKKHPYHTLLNYFAGYNQEFLNNPGKAAIHYNKAVSNAPKIREASLRLGIYMMYKQEYRAAESLIAEYTTINDTNCLALKNLGIVQMYQNKYHKAIQSFNNYILRNPYDPDIWFNRANGYFYLSRFGNAIEDYNRVLALRPQDKESHYLKGYCYYYLDQPDSALTCLNKSLEINNYYFEPLDLKTTICMEQKNYSQAINCLNKLLDIENNNVNRLVDRGISYYHVGKFDKAIEDLNQAINLDPNIAIAYYTRGQCYLKLDEKDLGCSDIKKSRQMGFEPSEKDMDETCN